MSIASSSNGATFRWVRRRSLLGAAAGASVLAAAGCGDRSKDAGDAAKVDTKLSLLASIEARDIDLLLRRAMLESGLDVTIEYVGTAEMNERVLEGNGADAILPSMTAFPRTMLSDKVLAVAPLYTSPLVVAVKTSKAQQLKWVEQTPAWEDVAAAAREGAFRFVMGNPLWSASGMAALLSTVTSSKDTADKTAGYEVHLNRGADLISGARLLSASASWLGPQYVKEDAFMDGMIVSEAIAMKVNERREGAEKLVLIYPTDGSVDISTSLMLIKEDKRAVFTKFAGALLDQRMQTEIVKQTYERPRAQNVSVVMGTPDVRYQDRKIDGLQWVVPDILEDLVQTWLPGISTYFVLPVGGSVTDPFLATVRDGLMPLTGQGRRSVLDKAMTLRDDDRVVFLPYGRAVGKSSEFSSAEGPVQTQRAQIAEWLGQLKADAAPPDAPEGSLTPKATTKDVALFDAVEAAHRLSADERRSNPARRINMIVLVADQNSVGPGVFQFHDALSSIDLVRTFAILTGNGSPIEAKAIVDAAGGLVLDTRSVPLARAWKEARAYY